VISYFCTQTPIFHLLEKDREGRFNRNQLHRFFLWLLCLNSKLRICLFIIKKTQIIMMWT